MARFRRSSWATLVALAVPAVAHAGIPPFCDRLSAPPAECDAPAPLPCGDDCAVRSRNGIGAWIGYWERCGQSERRDFTLEQKRFMCASPDAGELHVLHYTPLDEWLCCVKNPFSGKPGG